MQSRRPPIDYIERTRARYSALGHAAYRWVENPDAPPFASLAKPLRDSRLALVASGGIYRHGQIAFHYRDDVSFRIIESDVPTVDLRATHFAYDLTDARSDPNVVFPIDTLRSMVKEGRLGSLGPRAYTFMGGIYSARKVRDKLAPAIADRVCEDEVDLALLVPV
jgi:D-proline reductase (dithiol) PrdB